MRNGPFRAQLVQCHVRCDREYPGAQVSPVLQPRVRAERAQERLLPRVLGTVSDEAPQVREHLVPVLHVEPLEGRHRLFRHDLHHGLKRRTVPGCEMRPRRRFARCGARRCCPTEAGIAALDGELLTLGRQIASGFTGGTKWGKVGHSGPCCWVPMTTRSTTRTVSPSRRSSATHSPTVSSSAVGWTGASTRIHVRSGSGCRRGSSHSTRSAGSRG